MNETIDFYTLAPISFVDVVTNKVLTKISDKKFKTTSDVCGLIFPLIGTANFIIDGKNYALKHGQIIHAGPNFDLQMEVTSDVAFEYAVIHFHLPKEEIANFPLYHSHFSITVGDNIKLSGMINQLIQNFFIPGGLSFLQSKALFLNILEEMILSIKRLMSETETEDISNIIGYIQQNYTEPLTVIDFAHYFGIERRKFTYLFEKNIGMTPNEYLTNLRMQKAQLLLRTSQLSVAHISEQVGYADHFYFSRVFKKVTSFSPSNFRKHMKDERNDTSH